MKTKALMLAVVAAALLISAAPAESAKWILGKGPTDLEVGPPPGAAPGAICTTRVHGRAGLHTYTDPAVTPPPSPPYPAITVHVYHGAPDTLAGAIVVPGGLHPVGTPTGFVLPPVANATVTPTALNPPDVYSDGGPIWEYAAAPFQIAIPAGTIAAGDDVIVQRDNNGGPASGSAYLTGTAAVCRQETWRGLTWNVKTAGDVQVTQSPKTLAVTIGTRTGAQPVATYFSDCTITGDFDVHLHYVLNTWPAASSVRAALLVNNPTYPSPNGSVTLERTSFAATGDVGSGENYVFNAVDSGGGFLAKPTAALSGDLRVRQLSGAITTYYRDSTTAGKWKKLGTTLGYPGSVTLGLQIWGDQTKLPGPVTATFSKFTLTKGLCV